MTDKDGKEIKLRSCPFCGKPPVMSSFEPVGGYGDEMYVIACEHCEARASSIDLEMCVEKWNNRPSLFWRECPECGEFFEAPSDRYIYCRPCAKARLKAQIGRQYIPSAVKNADKLKPKPCEWCGEIFTPTRVDKRFCCAHCRDKYQFVMFNQKHYEKIKCPICKQEFQPKRSNQRCCCHSCANKYSRLNAMEKAKAEREAANREQADLAGDINYGKRHAMVAHVEIPSGLQTAKERMKNG